MPATPFSPPTSARSNLHGALAMLAAVGFFSLMDALLKTLSGSYPAMQVAALRGLGALPLVVAYVLLRRQGHALLGVRWPLHTLRGVLVVAMLALFTFGLKSLGLAEAYTLFFIAPLLIAVLSGPVLREKVRPAHWIALAVGALGVLVALRPDERALLSLGGLAVLAAALMYAISAVVGRVLTRTDSSATIVFWTTTMLALGAGLLALPAWVAVAPQHWPLVLALAVTGFLGQAAITEAFRHGQASVVAPLEYTALAWGIGLEWVVWQALPSAATLLGGAIVVAGGVYLMGSERRRHKDVPARSVEGTPQRQSAAHRAEHRARMGLSSHTDALPASRSMVVLGGTTMTDDIPTENATIHAGVRYTPGDGAPIEIRPGPAQVSRGADSTMLSWTNDNDAAGSAAMPVAEFERYVQSGKITFGKP